MLVALDFETTGLQMYSPTEFVKSVALAWRDGSDLKTAFFDTVQGIESCLEHLSKNQTPIVVYNIGFELLVLKNKYPQFPLNITIDCMRLVQNYDNGEDIVSFGLKAAAKRILEPEEANWEEEANMYLARHNLSKAELHKLPRDILARYNIGDAKATLLITEIVTEHFFKIGFDWTKDHAFYLSTAEHVVRAKSRGVIVDVEGALKYVTALEKDLEEGARLFIEQAGENITKVEDILTVRAQENYNKKVKFKKKTVERVQFNVNSNDHRTILFVEVMGVEPCFFTKKGQPSMKKIHLKQFGTLAESLEKRKNKQVVLTQLKNLIALAEEDGKWHVDLKLVGTSTSRFAGGQQ